ncbi:MAG: hypothetical protein IJO76_07975 [Clostridia bacterium]|nr:hypothetical protein [Clostridia bacterium]
MSERLEHADFPGIWDAVEQRIAWDECWKKRNRLIVHGALAAFGFSYIPVGCLFAYYLMRGERIAATPISDFGARLTALFPSDWHYLLRMAVALFVPIVVAFVAALLLRLICLAIPAKYTLPEGVRELRGVEAGEAMYFHTKGRYIPKYGDDFTHWTHTLIFLLCFILPIAVQAQLGQMRPENVAWLVMTVLVLFIGFLPMLLLRKISLALTCTLLCKHGKCYTVSERAEEYVDFCVKEAEDAREQQQKAAKQREADRLKKDGALLYENAVSGEEVNQRLMRQAAELGHPKACFYVGKQQYEQTGRETLTKTEREEAMERICCFFDDAYNGGEKQALFYSILCRVEYEENTQADWQKMLDTLRRMKADEAVPEGMEPACDEAIGYIVECIDRMEAKKEKKRREEAQKPTPAEYRKKALSLEAAGHYSDAKRYFKMAAEGGDSLGMDNYARHCLIEGNRGMAIYWLEKSIATGEYDDLSCQLLRALKNGEHVNVSYYDG